VNDSLIRKELLDILACPACDDRPRVEMTDSGLLCPRCGRVYPIDNGIPVMLVEKATIKHRTQGE